MKFAAAATALFAGLAAAAPSAKARRTDYVDLTFWAAAENTFTDAFPIDGSSKTVDSDLSFTYISSDGAYNVKCEAHGIDGSVTYVYGSAVSSPSTSVMGSTEQPY